MLEKVLLKLLLAASNWLSQEQGRMGTGSGLCICKLFPIPNRPSPFQQFKSRKSFAKIFTSEVCIGFRLDSMTSVSGRKKQPKYQTTAPAIQCKLHPTPSPCNTSVAISIPMGAAMGARTTVGERMGLGARRELPKLVAVSFSFLVHQYNHRKKPNENKCYRESEKIVSSSLCESEV